MDHRDFDRLVRSLAAGASRRSVLRGAAASAAASPLAVLGLGAAATSAQGNAQGNSKDKKDKKDENQGNNAGGGCRGDGHPCVGNQECCDGLDCRRTGPGNTLRCAEPGAAPTTNQTCVEDCQPVSQTVIGDTSASFAAPASYWVEVACTFDAPIYQTVCTCAGYGQQGAPRVQRVTLPVADICAYVIQEETRPQGEQPQASGGDTNVEASAGTGGEANADASGGAVSVGDVDGGGDTTVAIDASGGTADADASGGDNNTVVVDSGPAGGADAARAVDPSLLTLTLEGEVVPGRLTTYWLETDAGRRPAPGPALVQVASDTAGQGAIVAEAMVCDIADPRERYDWFGQCGTPAVEIGFSLYAEQDEVTPLATQAVNAQGRAHFGNLAPGIYQLKSEGANWCYAESDRVDGNGNVVVETDLESHVWSFVCGG